VETVDSPKLAQELNKAASQRITPLKIFIQVNTSQEESKGGVKTSECIQLASEVISSLKNLHFSGLMTIGSVQSPDLHPNPDFLALISCRDEVCDKLKLDPNTLHLSMGMSDDFEHAIECGSTNVRVGSMIFGTRNYSEK